MQNQRDDVIVHNLYHDVNKIGEENKGMTIKDWVTKSFNHQHNKPRSTINNQQEYARIETNQLVEHHNNEAQIHKQAKENINKETLIQKEHQKSEERITQLCFNTLPNNSKDSYNNKVSDTKSIAENKGSNKESDDKRSYCRIFPSY